MPLIFSPLEVVSKKYDFIIVGGGTCGLVLANRLSEDGKFEVLVLEAGNANIDDPLIKSPDGWISQMWDSEYDWTMSTTPQRHAKNRVIAQSRGKGLGGTSSINCLAWLKPHKVDLEVIEKLGNPGWNWDNYLRYSKKPETFQEPVGPSRPFKPTYNTEHLGNQGPLTVTFAPVVSGVEHLYQAGVNDLNIETISTGYNGQTTGTFKSLSTLDPITGSRTTSASAYLFPVADRSNLTVLTNALVTKLITSNDDTEEVRVDGVEFEHGNNTFSVLATKDVILSAGNLKSPQILELSGIGDPAILEPLGIDTVITLPAVGTNMQDHFSCVGPIPEFKKGHDVITWNLLQDPDFRATLKDPYDEIEGHLAPFISGFTFYPAQKTPVDIDPYLREFSDKLNDPNCSYPPGLKEQYKIQLELLRNDTLPHFQTMVTPFTFFPLGPPDRPYVDLESILCRPFSRGTIHIESADPHDPPIIDPHLFEEEIDLDLLMAAFKMVRQLTRSPHLQSVIEKEVQPLSDIQMDELIKDYVRANTRSTQSSVGTCSMLPKEKGGVVDPKLRVYGTKNLRIVDVSIIPLIISSPLQATAYAIAEQASDIIKADFA